MISSNLNHELFWNHCNNLDNKKQEDRLDYWDNLKAILIIAVVLGHFLEYSKSEMSPAFKSIFIFIYSFHMPLFIFVCGVFYKDKGLFKRIGYYLTIYFLFKIIIFAEKSALGMKASFSILKENGIPWFMFACAIYTIMGYFLKRFSLKSAFIASVIIACIVGYDAMVGDYFVASRIIVYLPFYIAGMWCKNYKIELTRRKKIIATIVLISWLSLCFFKLDWVYVLRPLFTGRNAYSGIFLPYGFAYRLLCYLITSLAIWALLVLTPQKKIMLLSHIGRATLQIYFWHMIILLILVKQLGINNLLCESPIGKIVYALISVVLVIFLSVKIFEFPLINPVKKYIFDDTRISFDEFVDIIKLRTKRLVEKDGELYITVLFAFIATYIVCGSLSLYLSNSEEFWFGLNNALTAVLLSVCITILVLLFISIMLSQKALENFSILLFGVTIAIYIQGIINIKYGNGVLDGTEIIWKDYWVYSVIDLLVWGICISVPFWICKKAKEYWKKIFIYASLFIVAIQFVGIGAQIINYKPNLNDGISITKENIYDLSNGQNLIIFILDTMDEKYYESFISEHPEYKDKLRGFIHYDNTLASGARTIIGLPSMLTGSPFRYEGNFSEYIANIWDKDNPFRYAYDCGANVGIYSEDKFFSIESQKYIDNITLDKTKVSSYGLLANKIMKLSTYTYFPQALKPAFWVDTAEYDEAKEAQNLYKENDYKFYKEYKDNGGFNVVDKYDKSIRIYHLNGAHKPYSLDREAKRAKETSLSEQVEGVFFIVSEMLEGMKKKEVYDNATIVITADHGDLNYSEHPLFLMKEANTLADYNTSNKPVSLFDLPQIIYSFMGEKGRKTEFGMPLNQIIDDKRERHFFLNKTGSMNISVLEYTLNGDINEDEIQFEREYEDYKSGDEVYEFGTKLTFDIDGTANAYCVDGFEGTTGWQTRMRGPKSLIRIPVEGVPDIGKLLVEYKIGDSKYISDNLDYVFYVNDVEVLHETTSEDMAYSVVKEEIDIDSKWKDAKYIELRWDFISLNNAELSNDISQRTVTFPLKYIMISVE